MTEAGQLEPDDAIWHEGRVWWMTERNSLGEVIVSDAPEHSDVQVRGLVFQPHDEVLRAGEALMDARGRHDDAVTRMRRAFRISDFEEAAAEARKANRDMVAMEAAGVVARYQP